MNVVVSQFLMPLNKPREERVYIVQYRKERCKRNSGNSGKRGKGYSAVCRRGVSGNGVIVVLEERV